MISAKQLESHLQDLLSPHKFKDYCPNGLQVEGKKQVKKVVMGVSATQAFIDQAIAANADAIIVHHGYFWKGEDQCITAIKKKRLQSLLTHDINLFAYHLPLDVHASLGNNAQLAKLMNWQTTQGLEKDNPLSVGLVGTCEPITAKALQDLLSQKLNFKPLMIGNDQQVISNIAWCTGGAQSYLQLAIDAGCDAFVTGEISENTVHLAQESGIHFYAAGHHATETGGVKALGDHLKDQFDIEVEFIDCPVPV